MSTCFRPVHSWRGVERADGKAKIVFRPPTNSVAGTYVPLPCNSCVGCRMERARQWAMRCMDEASLFERNCFITLTFDDKHLPMNRSVDKRIFQLFMKRLRKMVSPVRFRFFACGEYGTLHGRPHYHALLFNYDFGDRVFLKMSEAGEKVYTSESLQEVWPYGYCSVADVSFGSAAYVARYHLKKVGSVVENNDYLNKVSGEILAPEFVLMSRGSGKQDPDPRFRFGIGAGWIQQYLSDVYPQDARVIKGVDTKPCKFYDRFYEKRDPVAFASVKRERVVGAAAFLADNTPARLAVKEKVFLARIKSLSSSREV